MKWSVDNKRILGLLTLAFFSVSNASMLQAERQTQQIESGNKRAPKKNIRILTFTDKKKAQEIRAKAIRSIRELLDQTKDPARKYELMRRYGELFAEQAEYALEKEMIIYDEKYERWQTRGRKGKEPQLDNTNSKLSLEKAVSIYKSIVANYPNYPGVDITYYELGKNLLRLDDNGGVVYLNKLLKEHPKSLYVPEALFALGEHYFNSHDMINAKKYYNQAAKYKDHQIYPYAIYKLGWTYYNFPAETAEDQQEKFAKAVTAFKLVVKLSSTKNEEEDRRIYLRQEAINDLVMVWAETKDVESAWTYFRKIGDQEAFYRMLEKLGAIYVANGELKDAAQVYSRILREVPNRVTNFENHKELVNIYKERNMHGQVVKNARAMAELYLAGGAWYKANESDKELVTEAANQVEINIHRWAATYHDEAIKRKGNADDLFKVAAKLYMTYLAKFPTNPKAYELRYFLAEALFSLKKYDPAATQFMIVVSENKKDGKHLEKAALGAVEAMALVVSGSKFPAVPEPGRVPNPIKIPNSKLKYRKALDQYVELFPNHKDAMKMEATATQITYDYGHYDDAMVRLKNLALNRKGTPQSEEAVKTVLKHYSDPKRKDWDRTIEYCKLFLGNKDVLKGELRKSTLELLIVSSFERALEMEKKGKPIEAAEAFLAFQKDFPQDKRAPKAIYNAMLLFRNNGYIDRALSAAKLVLEKYPKFDQKDDVVIAISEAYEGMGDYANAAKFYNFFAKNWPTDKRAARYLFASGILFKGAKQNDRAIEAMQQFIAAYPSDEYQLPAQMELAGMLEEEKRLPEAIAVYSDIAKRYKASRDEAALAQVKVVTLNTSTKHRFGNPQELARLQKWLAAKDSPNAPLARRELSKAMFNKLEEPFKDFVTSKIDNSSIQVLQSSIQSKQEELLRLVEEYQRIIAIGYPDHVVASTYRIGQGHEAFSLTLLNTRAPKDFNAQEKITLAAQLKQASEPLKDDAVKFYKTAYDHANEAGVFTVWATRAYDRMSKLDPKQSPSIAEFSVDPGYASHSISYDKSVATVLH